MSQPLTAAVHCALLFISICSPHNPLQLCPSPWRRLQQDAGQVSAADGLSEPLRALLELSLDSLGSSFRLMHRCRYVC